MPTFVIVGATVKNAADRPGFDHWYSTDHMPKGRAFMNADKSWRHWSRTDPSLHYAIYRCSAEYFATLDVTPLKTEFDNAWPGVTRTVEVIEQVDEQVTA